LEEASLGWAMPTNSKSSDRFRIADNLPLACEWLVPIWPMRIFRLAPRTMNGAANTPPAEARMKSLRCMRELDKINRVLKTKK
jgi:hypothetical protein